MLLSFCFLSLTYLWIVDGFGYEKFPEKPDVNNGDFRTLVEAEKACLEAFPKLASRLQVDRIAFYNGDRRYKIGDYKYFCHVVCRFSSGLPDKRTYFPQGLGCGKGGPKGTEYLYCRQVTTRNDENGQLQRDCVLPPPAGLKDDPRAREICTEHFIETESLNTTVIDLAVINEKKCQAVCYKAVPNARFLQSAAVRNPKKIETKVVTPMKEGQLCSEDDECKQCRSIPYGTKLKCVKTELPEDVPNDKNGRHICKNEFKNADKLELAAPLNDSNRCQISCFYDGRNGKTVKTTYLDQNVECGEFCICENFLDQILHARDESGQYITVCRKDFDKIYSFRRRNILPDKKIYCSVYD